MIIFQNYSLNILKYLLNNSEMIAKSFVGMDLIKIKNK